MYVQRAFVPMRAGARAFVWSHYVGSKCEVNFLKISCANNCKAGRCLLSEKTVYVIFELFVVVVCFGHFGKLLQTTRSAMSLGQEKT